MIFRSRVYIYTWRLATAILGPKLLKDAKVSSFSVPPFVATNVPPAPPHFPSLSAIADTTIASGEFPGELIEASWPLLPAATTTTTPF